MATKDFYAVLGVAKAASEKEIRQAYRRLARQYHPDVNPDDAAAETRFKEINAANEVLSDAKKRRAYDRYGDQWQHADQIEEMQRRAGGASRFGQGGVHFGNAGDIGGLGGIFETLFRSQRARPQRRAATTEQRVELTLEEAYHGTARTLEFTSQEPCVTCGGSGQIAGAVCHLCQGSGTQQKSRRIEAKVPPGVRTGSRVRIAGAGGAGAGDLVLVVTVRNHERFDRKGDDLYVDVETPLTDAVLGAEVEVPTITGKVALTVPPLTQNGNLFRLADLGMPRLKDEGKGNLFARLKVVLPEKLSDDEKKLFEELREAGE